MSQGPCMVLKHGLEGPMDRSMYQVVGPKGSDCHWCCSAHLMSSFLIVTRETGAWSNITQWSINRCSNVSRTTLHHLSITSMETCWWIQAQDLTSGRVHLKEGSKSWLRWGPRQHLSHGVDQDLHCDNLHQCPFRLRAATTCERLIHASHSPSISC